MNTKKKNHFQSYPTYISVILSKISLRPHPLLKSLSAENKRVQKNDALSCETYLFINLSQIQGLPHTHFSKLYLLKVNFLAIQHLEIFEQSK